MGLHDFVLKLSKNLVLILWVLAKGIYQVLSRIARCLRACEEECEYLVYDAHISSLEMLVA
jgi:hypothetical protein